MKTWNICDTKDYYIYIYIYVCMYTVVPYTYKYMYILHNPMKSLVFPFCTQGIKHTL